MTENARFVVMTTSGNQGVAAAGSTLDALGIGQVGFYNAKTHQAIDTTVPATAYAEAQKDGFYIALGIDRDKDGTQDDIYRSFNVIYPDKFNGFTQKCAQNYQAKIITFGGCIIDFDKDYVLKFNLIAPDWYKNTEKSSEVTEFLTYTTESQVGATTDPDIYKMYSSFVTQFNNNKTLTAVLTMELLNPADDTVITDLATWVASNPGTAPKLRFTTKKPTHTPYINEFFDYVNPREIDVNLYPQQAFEQNGTVTIVQDMLFEHTSGKEVQELERIAGGWIGNPGPYREASFALKNINYLADETKLYSLITLYYQDVRKNNLSGPYTNDLSVVFAVPNGESTTGAGIVQTLGILLKGDANALSSTTC